jgi:hypothetical protein
MGVVTIVCIVLPDSVYKYRIFLNDVKKLVHLPLSNIFYLHTALIQM